MNNAPGKAYRKGITLKEILRMFPNDEIAEQWFTEQRWPDGVCCPACGSVNVQTGCQHQDDALPLPGEGVREEI